MHLPGTVSLTLCADLFCCRGPCCAAWQLQALGRAVGLYPAWWSVEGVAWGEVGKKHHLQLDVGAVPVLLCCQQLMSTPTALTLMNVSMFVGGGGGGRHDPPGNCVCSVNEIVVQGCVRGRGGVSSACAPPFPPYASDGEEHVDSVVVLQLCGRDKEYTM